MFYGSIWWSWVIPDAVFGIAVGLFASKFAINEGGFDTKKIVLFNVVQVLANIVAWVVCAPVLDILIYAEPANKVFVQGLMSAGVNIVTTAVVGTLLCFAYSKAIPKKGSLKEED